MSNELRQYRMQMLEDSRNAVDRADHVLEVLDRQLEQLNNSSQSLALMRTGLDAIAGHADALVMMTAEFLPTIIDALALNAERLQGIQHLLANPRAAGATEMYRNGSYALRAGWLDDATRGLTAAVEAFPYLPDAWFNLAVCRRKMGDDLVGFQKSA